MGKPTALPIFNINETDIVAPDTARQNDGFIVTGSIPEKPSYKLFNYLLNQNYKWFKYFDEREQSATHDMASDANYTLTAAQNNFGHIIITDTGVVLTTGRNIVVDDIERQISVQNLTLQTLTFKTSGGTGVAVPAGGYRVVRNDGTNVVEAGVRTGFKNLLINGSKTIQQRGTTGGRRQVIDAEDITRTEDATLSFTGTATVRIYEATTLGATDGGTTWSELTSGASNSGVTVSLTAGKYVKVEFSTTSFDDAQFEYGRFASEKEQRSYGLELLLCQRFYEARVTNFMSSYAGTSGSNTLQTHTHHVAKRVTPTVTLSNLTYSNASSASVSRNTIDGFSVVVSWSASGRASLEYDSAADAEHFTDTYFEDRWF